MAFLFLTLFGISFFVLEILTFSYYANEESDDVIGGSSKTVQHSIENISRSIKAMFFKADFQSVLRTLESLFKVAQ